LSRAHLEASGCHDPKQKEAFELKIRTLETAIASTYADLRRLS
jgi:hypothetical protein